MSKTTTADLQHADWCKAERIETTDYPDRGISTTHCCDCGAHEAKDRHGKTLKTPAVSGAMAGEHRDDSDLMRSTGGAA
jgi:hypothetical protein